MTPRTDKNREFLQLRSFIGSYGYQTRELIDSQSMCGLAASMFEVPFVDDVAHMAGVIAGLGQRERSKRANSFMYQRRGKKNGCAPRMPVPSTITPDKTAEQLLHEVVMAVINAGHASDLNDHPDVLRYFGLK